MTKHTIFWTRAGLTAGALAAATAAGLSGGGVAAHVAKGPLTCEITETRGARGTTYAGRVTSDAAVAGRYRLSLTQSGAGGSAVIDQSGDFRLAAGGAETLGETTLGGTPGRVDAELTVTWDGRSLTCRLDDTI